MSVLSLQKTTKISPFFRLRQRQRSKNHFAKGTGYAVLMIFFLFPPDIFPQNGRVLFSSSSLFFATSPLEMCQSQVSAFAVAAVVQGLKRSKMLVGLGYRMERNRKTFNTLEGLHKRRRKQATTVGRSLVVAPSMGWSPDSHRTSECISNLREITQREIFKYCIQVFMRTNWTKFIKSSFGARFHIFSRA